MPHMCAWLAHGRSRADRDTAESQTSFMALYTLGGNSPGVEVTWDLQQLLNISRIIFHTYDKDILSVSLPPAQFTSVINSLPAHDF